MKRSAAITLIAVGAGAVALQSGFGTRTDSEARSDGTVFTSKEQCASSGAVDKADCERGWDDALKDHEGNAPHYANMADCEKIYGAGKCTTPTSATGAAASYVIPAMMGYMIGRNWSQAGCRAAPLFRRPIDPKDQYQFSTGPCPAYASSSSTSSGSSSGGRGGSYHSSTYTRSGSTSTSRGGFGSIGRGFSSFGG